MKTKQVDHFTITVSGREQRLTELLDLIRANPGRWTTGRVHDLRKAAHRGPSQRGTAKRDLVELCRRGYLVERGPADGRFFLLATTNRQPGEVTA